MAAEIGEFLISMPFDSLAPILSSSIVTLALSASVSELQPLEKCLILIGRRFDHFRSSEGQTNGGNRPATHDFLFNFKSNHSLSITVLKL